MLGHKTGEQLAVFRGHQAEVAQVAFSQDGCEFMTASFDGTIRVWDAEMDTASQLRGHDLYVYDVAIHPIKNQIATVGWDGKMLQWALKDGRQIDQRQHPADVVTSVGEVFIFNLVSGSQRMVLKGQRKGILDVGFRPVARSVKGSSASHLATCSKDLAVRIWDL